MPRVMRVQGKVVGKVTIRDLGKEILYNQIVDIQEDQALTSKDLVHAYNNRWIDILSGGELLDDNPEYTTPARHYSKKPVAAKSEQISQPAAAPQQDLSIVLEQLTSSILSGLGANLREIVRDEISKMNPVPAPMAMDHSQIAAAVAERIAGMVPATAQSHGAQIPDIDKQSRGVFINLDGEGDLKSSIPETGVGQVVESDDTNAGDAIRKLSRLKKMKGD